MGLDLAEHREDAYTLVGRRSSALEPVRRQDVAGAVGDGHDCTDRVGRHNGRDQ